MEEVFSFIIWGFFWILWSITGYRIAKRKGRNAVVWALMGFLFGILALILLALLPSKAVKRSGELVFSEKR